MTPPVFGGEGGCAKVEGRGGGDGRIVSEISLVNNIVPIPLLLIFFEVSREQSVSRCVPRRAMHVRVEKIVSQKGRREVDI